MGGNRDFGEKQGGVTAAGVSEGFHRQTDGGDVSLGVESLGLAQADQQHALAQAAGQIVYEQCRTRLAVHVAATQDVAERTCGSVVEQFGRQGELPLFKNAHDHAATPLLFRASAFYAKFHALLLCARADRSIGGQAADYPRILKVSSKHDLRARRAA